MWTLKFPFESCLSTKKEWWMLKRSLSALGNSSPNPHPPLMPSGLLWVWIKFGCHVPSLPTEPSRHPCRTYMQTRTHLAIRSSHANFVRHSVAHQIWRRPLGRQRSCRVISKFFLKWRGKKSWFYKRLEKSNWNKLKGVIHWYIKYVTCQFLCVILL